MQVRLQKILSQAGVTSRRKAEEFIRQGRVRVNGKVIYELGTKADPDRDEIHFDGKKIEPKQPRISVLLNKPDGYITSLRDPEGRPTVAKLVDNLPVRLYPVGRLDYHTEGLLILTNDGELAQQIEHPSHQIEKVYLAKVKGIPHPNELKRLREGIVIEGRKTLPATIKIVETRKNAWIEVVIREGRQNQIRKMFDVIGHPVLKLKRIAIGSLRDDNLKPGEYRMLKSSEIRRLLEGTTPKRKNS
ncbi:MAG TPA: pseudouridine synthase [Acidobacteriota bacterium]|jgi:pseudouridine synthase|nr:pseudouridine synthase [Acidobacteriota bacterium]